VRKTNPFNDDMVPNVFKVLQFIVLGGSGWGVQMSVVSQPHPDPLLLKTKKATLFKNGETKDDILL